MSKLKIGRFVLALVTTLGMGVLPGSCAVIYIDSYCVVTDDCYTDWNFAGNGTLCISGRCVCGAEGQVACCPDRAERCENDVYDCRPAADCVTCQSDDECPGPPDPRCGAGRCINRKCELEIRADQPIASQFPGDCKLTLCTGSGEIKIVADPSDVPHDGNRCTFDSCKDDQPTHTSYHEIPCPGKDYGVCIDGACVDCSEKDGALFCPGNWQCSDEDCAPSTCNDTVMNGQETGEDCGGPECLPCEIGLPCLEGRDCLSGSCVGQVCHESTHDDNIKNDSETGVDCGYSEGPPHPCPDGQGCHFSTDCQSSVCFDGVCLPPSCTDATQNGLETGEDCGGDCSPCPG